MYSLLKILFEVVVQRTYYVLAVLMVLFMALSIVLYNLTHDARYMVFFYIYLVVAVLSFTLGLPARRSVGRVVSRRGGGSRE